jgi:hypothetical protein
VAAFPVASAPLAGREGVSTAQELNVRVRNSFEISAGVGVSKPRRCRFELTASMPPKLAPQMTGAAILFFLDIELT